MSEDRAPVTAYVQPTGDDLVPGMVTVVEDRGPALVPDRPGQTEGFDLVLRGYDRHQVDAHLARTAALVTDMQEALAAAGARESAYAAELAAVRAELERGRPTFDALGERVAQMLTLAEAEAAQMRSDAEHDATALRAAAEREAADIRSDARREADELGATARREVASLSTRRQDLLSDIETVRDQLDALATGRPELPPPVETAELAAGDTIVLPLGDESPNPDAVDEESLDQQLTDQQLVGEQPGDEKAGSKGTERSR
jgi:DivIVA domain-containing protein